MVDGTCVERGGYDYMGAAVWGVFAILRLVWRTTVLCGPRAVFAWWTRKNLDGLRRGANS